MHGLLDREDGRCNDSFQALFVDRKLDGDVREVVIDVRVGLRLDGRVVGGVLMVLGDGAEDETDVADELEAEELREMSGLVLVGRLWWTYNRHAENDGEGDYKGESGVVSIKCPLLQEVANTCSAKV